MMYDHTETLKTVAPEDVSHVEKMLSKLDAYARTGGNAPLGDFLTALVVSDMLEAVVQADDTNVKYLREYVQYVYNCLPSTHVSLARDAIVAVRQSKDFRLEAGKRPLAREDIYAATGALRTKLNDIP